MIEIKLSIICSKCGCELKADFAEPNKCISVEPCNTCVEEILEEAIEDKG